MRTRAIALVLALAALLGLGSVGCSKQLKNMVIPNQAPTVRLTVGPVSSNDKVFYVYQMKWVGYDPDGRVDHFEYIIDPPTESNVDMWAGGSTWKVEKTELNEKTIKFPAIDPDSAFLSDYLNNNKKPESRGFHVFAIRAVDNLGAHSETVMRAFNCFGVAPEVKILQPEPSRLYSPNVTPSMLVNWQGRDWTDETGVTYEKPLGYKYKLYKKGDEGVHWDAWVADPDSLRREVAPKFEGWTSVGPDTTEHQFENLVVGSEYMFAIVAISAIGDSLDERPYGSGAYSPIFSLDGNMLRVYVSLAGAYGPIITLYNSYFSFTYPNGGFSDDPSKAIQIQVPAGDTLPHEHDGVPSGPDPQITINWFAVANEGSLMKRYRWVLDLGRLDDETARSSPKDWYHWSAWSLNNLSASFGPFPGTASDLGEVHNFYLEAEDVNGLRSLGWVQLRVFRPVFDKDLLVVNDTRFKSDVLARGRTDSLGPPSGVWPTRAELDTFLFAVGGVRWRMTPTGKLSPAGIFKGYAFDTMGTRYGREDPTVSLGLLDRYKHIVWMTDQKAVDGYTLKPNSPTLPQTTLYYMSVTNRQNTLATWVNQGGKLWALGGGFGHATNASWNNVANDVANGQYQVRTYSNVTTPADLKAGRFMFDLAHWRSAFRVLGPAFVSFARYDQPDPTVQPQPPAPPAWQGGTFTNPQVDYSFLPPSLEPRSVETDPVSAWPYRSSGDYYVGNPNYSYGVNFEFLSLENYILEEGALPGGGFGEISKLDSLYLVYGSSLPYHMNQSSNGEGVNVAMTYYHGQDNPEFVFSGMSIWDFRRQDCLGLVDFVLGRLWGLSRRTLYTAPRTVAPSSTRRVAVSAPQTFQRPPGAVRQPVGVSTFLRRR